MVERTAADRLAALEAGQAVLERGHDLLANQVAGFGAVMQKAVAEGMRDGMAEIIADPQLLDAFWAAAVQRGQRGIHEQAGRWLFSRWTAVIALVFLFGQTVGWGVVVKAVLGVGLAKGSV